MSRRFRIFAASLVAALLAIDAGAGSAPLPADSVYQLDASLRDQDGRAIAWSGLRGRPRVVTMFYAGCRSVCPMTVEAMRAIERGLTAPERTRVGFVLVTMDPEHDTPAALAKLMAERRLTAPGWLAVRPEPDDLRSLAGVLGVRYRKVADGEFSHTTVQVVLDPEGRVVARSERVGPTGDPDLLAAVRRLVAAAP